MLIKPQMNMKTSERTAKMAGREIRNLSDFIARIEELNKTNKDNIVVFRGQKSTSYRLIPFIGRFQDNKQVRNDERSMYNEYRRLYYPYTEHRPTKKMDILFLAQHYGLPTRLLDWTFNPLVALYFACEKVTNKTEEKNGKVYVKIYAPQDALLKCGDDEPIISNSGANEDEDPFIPHEGLRPTCMIMPDNIDVRYRNQQGIFEYFVDPWKEDDNVLSEIIIPSNAKNKILESISWIEIDEKFIYPDMERLTKYIKEKYMK